MNYYINATTEHLSNSCFSGKYSLQTVDLQNVPYVNNDMNSAFRALPNLTNVTNIADSVELMDCTFQNCVNLVNVSELPTNVTYMGGTFAECTSLVNAPEIPENVDNMQWAFANCWNIIDSPNIPNSVSSICGTFEWCYNLVNAPVIGNSVTNMQETFRGCWNLVNAPIINTDVPVTTMSYAFHNCYNMSTFPNIPNSVTNMSWAFRACYQPTVSPVIPNSVTNMCGAFCIADHLQTVGEIGTGVIDMNRAFGWCPNIVGDVVIRSSNVTNAISCFTSSNSAKHKDVYIPFTYQNGVNTATYNAFRDAGYTTTGTSQGVYLKDLQYYNTTHTLTVNTVPSESTVTFDSSDPNAVISGKSITAKPYSSLNITTECEGYVPNIVNISSFGPWTGNYVDVNLSAETDTDLSDYDYEIDENNNVKLTNYKGVSDVINTPNLEGE